MPFLDAGEGRPQVAHRLLNLEDLGGGQTRATYSLDADPGRVLGMLVRGPAEAAILAGLVNARRDELKLRIENA